MKHKFQNTKALRNRLVKPEDLEKLLIEALESGPSQRMTPARKKMIFAKALKPD
jgi:hypothetical protein